MAKRTATTELNHENWDDNEETEDAGSFQRAPEEVIQKRVIRMAKRRNPISQANEDPEKKSVFSNFQGFSKSPSSTSFAFLSNLTNKANGISATDSTATLLKPIESNIFTQNNLVAPKTNTKPVFDKSSEYYSKLKGLNESVSQWIKTHVDKNPFCILTPIFKDYEKYLKEIENKNEKIEINVSTTNIITSPTPSIFAVEPKTVEEPSDFMFKSSSTTAFGSTPGFSFGSAKPFSFSNVTQPATEDEDADEPPKVEFTPVVEDGSIYNKRCKVFVKKDNNFADRGVGQLFLKPIADSEKIQLIVRANTSLGSLLLNFILSKSIPIQKMGKNNVMLVCIPTPDSQPPPTPVLLRVKTSEEADELINALEKHKK